LPSPKKNTRFDMVQRVADLGRDLDPAVDRDRHLERERDLDLDRDRDYRGPSRMPAPVLLEIGVEELPSSFVDAALAALPDLVTARLTGMRLTHGAVRALGTPRRLAVLVDDVTDRQSDVDEEVTGPPETAAFKGGAPTRAAEAFAAKIGVGVSDLSVVEKPAQGKQKAGRYVVGRRVEPGKYAYELLGKALADVASGIRFRKSMRWGAGEATFGRPVQWLVALYGNDVLDLSFAGTRSGRVSRGHRFLAPASFDVPSAGAYVEALRARHVLVDRGERARVMMEKVAKAAHAAGGTHDSEPSLVDENASLVEEPHVITGTFDAAFLELPAAVIRAVARGHQKYFCVHRSEGDLLPSYIAVVNTANDPAKVIKGNDKAMRARLSDARFFFEEDKRANLEERVEKLSGITFHNELGTVREKVQRMERLTGALAVELGLNPEVRRLAERAAHLSKFDLVSLMVGEFPELQGLMGSVYAKSAGESDRVAQAIVDHYRPVGASDSVAPDDVSAIVALADRLDTLTGCFAVGLEPTGATDPYALRRACIAILRTLLDKGHADPRYAKINLIALVRAAYEGYQGKLAAKGEPEPEVLGRVTEFARERLRGLIASATSGPVADAVLAGVSIADGNERPIAAHPVYALAKARALHAVVGERQPWLEKAKTVAKRLAGISKEADPRLHPEDFSGKKTDVTIVRLVAEVDGMTRALFDEMTIRRALAGAEKLAHDVDQIFVTTLVNDPSDPKTRERLEVLSYGARCMLRIADFARLG
jgi:glycyl-tRNA synthetase beta chain